MMMPSAAAIKAEVRVKARAKTMVRGRARIETAEARGKWAVHGSPPRCAILSIGQLV